MKTPEVTAEVLDWASAAAVAMPVREAVFVIGQGVPAELDEVFIEAGIEHRVMRRRLR